MLFNSYAFLLVFLPVFLVLFFWFGKRSQRAAVSWLGASSLAFYAWWDYRDVALLLASIVFNFFVGTRLAASAGTVQGKRLLTLAVAINLVGLAWFKYADFGISVVNALTGGQFALLGIALPIGISFFTFTQIAFLIDTWQGKAREYNFPAYLAFVTYFPHLVAGPILHHKEMVPQFMDRAILTPRARHFAIGFTVFSIGLAKKVLIADNLAPFAGDLFRAPANPNFLAAWGGTLAYAFQLYFDFSGYSDMAIGLSRMIGVRLPINFHSPYKSVNIVEFWRRWHMTLSRYLRDYLYIPLGGNRKGPMRRQVNLLLTMLLGGLWHGAGLNFIIWGGLHGLYLVINHGWLGLKTRLGLPALPGGRFLGVTLTFIAVCSAWVFFRAADVPSAMQIVGGMTGFNGVALPQAFADRLPWLTQLGGPIQLQFYLGGGGRFVELWMWVVFAASIAFFAPNTQEIMRRVRPALPSENFDAPWIALVWKPRVVWAIGIGVLGAIGFLSLSNPSEFLYFQF
jgi:D-alanyl-lipoteichoic acid acyltransferase DltB (MBOAT superfamily)